VPAVVSEETFARVAQRLADNKRFASRNSRNPSLLQGIAACAACGYGYYRTTTRTTNKKIHYYRCLGSDNYRYEAGRVCANKPVRADYLDTVVWDHITGLLAEPRLIHAEIDKRLEGARAADPVTRQRTQLENALGTAANGIARMIEAFGEQLITIDELRARMPDLRAREANLRNQIQALDAQLADREAYLALAADLQGFLTQLHARAETSTLDERRRVLKLLIKDVLIGPEKITIRHRIPLRERVSSDTQHTGNTDTEGEHPEHCPVRWGRNLAVAGQRLPAPGRSCLAGRRAWGAGALCRRRRGDVSIPGTGSGRAGAVDGPVGRAWVGAQAGQDPHRAPGRGRRGAGLPGLPQSVGARVDSALGAFDLSRPLARTQGGSARPRSDPVDHRPVPAAGAGRADRGGTELVPPRLGRIFPLRELRSDARPD
jgi:hypothetical protein